jgi:hypothetical protein
MQLDDDAGDRDDQGENGQSDDASEAESKDVERAQLRKRRAAADKRDKGDLESALATKVRNVPGLSSGASQLACWPNLLGCRARLSSSTRLASWPRAPRAAAVATVAAVAAAAAATMEPTASCSRSCVACVRARSRWPRRHPSHLLSSSSRQDRISNPNTHIHLPPHASLLSL